MKKRHSRLKLHKETLLALQVRPGIAGGGGNTFEILTGCACTDSCCCGSNGCGSATCTDTDGCPGITNEIMSGCATNC